MLDPRWIKSVNNDYIRKIFLWGLGAKNVSGEGLQKAAVRLTVWPEEAWTELRPRAVVLLSQLEPRATREKVKSYKKNIRDCSQTSRSP